MLVLNHRLLGQPVVSIQTGGQLGRITEAIIDPRQLKIVAFHCTGPLLKAGDSILHSEDIREISSIGLIVNSADNIMASEDLIRLKEVLNFKFRLEDKLVVEESGRKVGKVAAYSVETSSFYIIKLHIKPGFLGSFSATERIIDRSQIIEITPQKIVVKAAAVRDESRAAPKSKPVIDNPFRRATAQPDTSIAKQN